MKAINNTGPCENPDCNGTYKLYRTTDPKYCSPGCLRKCKPPKEKKPSDPIKRRSDKRATEERTYLQMIKPFLAKHKVCPVTGGHTSEVHHKKGRIGKLLLDSRYWLAVSSEGHKKIELNPIWAKEMGYSLSRLENGEEE